MHDPAQAYPSSRLNAIDTTASSLYCGGTPFVDLLRRFGARRPGAEYLAWPTVHGMALLSIDGPLRGTPQGMPDALRPRLLDRVERGI